MNSRATIKWVGLALVGLLVAAGVAIAASNLASRQIGLASEPISAGDALAPAASPDRGHDSQGSGHGHGDRTTPATPVAPTPTAPEPEITTPAPAPESESTSPAGPAPESSDDHGSGSHGADD
jgi:hypothetical protein